MKGKTVRGLKNLSIHFIMGPSTDGLSEYYGGKKQVNIRWGFQEYGTENSLFVNQTNITN